MLCVNILFIFLYKKDGKLVYWYICIINKIIYNEILEIFLYFV